MEDSITKGGRDEVGSLQLFARVLALYGGIKLKN